MLFADAACGGVTMANSSFLSNSAGTGAVSFLDGWRKRSSRRTSPAPACTGNCTLANNTAAFWGASVAAATNIAAVELVLSRRTVSSGSTFSASVALRDGFGELVGSPLPGVSFLVSCENCSSGADDAALVGAAAENYDGLSHLDGLSILGAPRDYALQVSVNADDRFVASPLNATLVMTVVGCSLTEEFDEAAGSCICVANSARNRDGDCQCSAGTHALFTSPKKGATLLAGPLIFPRKSSSLAAWTQSSPSSRSRLQGLQTGGRACVRHGAACSRGGLLE